MNDFRKCIEQIGQKMGTDRAFGDFLTFSVCALSIQEKEDLYLKTAKIYTEKEMMLFSEAFALMILEMDDNGKGFNDCLGDYFMEYIGSRIAGQFFTPQHICDLMAHLTSPKIFQTVNDPACGSGRLILSAGKLRKHNFFFAEDINYQCCQMTLINMCLNGLFGVVTHKNTLSNEVWHQWEIKLHPKHKFPYIHEINLSEDNEANLVNLIEQKQDPVLIEPDNIPLNSLLTKINSML